MSKPKQPAFFRSRVAGFLLLALPALNPALAAPGTPDVGFNLSGSHIHSFGVATSFSIGLGVDADQKVIISVLTSTGLEIARFLPNGQFDNSFDTDGVADGFAFFCDDLNNLRVQKDRKVLFFGYLQVGAEFLPCLGRLRQDGSPDPTFGSSGRQVFGMNGAFIRSIAILPDGKILAAVSDSFGNFSLLMRLTSKGKPDPTFGKKGIVKTTLPQGSQTKSLAVQRDGKILVAGSDKGLTSFLLRRFLEDGSPDPAFGVNGVRKTSIGPGYCSADSMAIGRDGKIVLAGDSLAGADGRLTVARYRSDGSLDQSFATNGIFVATTGNTFSNGTDILIQRDGKQVISSRRTSSGNIDGLIWRLNKNGVPDNTFGVNGQFTVDLFADELSNQIELQKDGRLLVAGEHSGNAYVLRTLNGPHPPDARAGTTAAVPIGNNFFNFDGLGSTQKVKVASGKTRTAFFAVENEGLGAQRCTVFAAAGNADFQVRYFDGPTDVTALVTVGLFTTPTIKPRKRFVLRAKITALGGLGAAHNIFMNCFSEIDATGDQSRMDLRIQN